MVGDLFRRLRGRPWGIVSKLKMSDRIKMSKKVQNL
jgi:hypothetical protein